MWQCTLIKLQDNSSLYVSSLAEKISKTKKWLPTKGLRHHHFYHNSIPICYLIFLFSVVFNSIPM